ncbi:MAG: DUF2332 domain-containing protein [Acidimicrobiales bacterium]
MHDRVAGLERIVEVIAFQAQACRASPSPLYGRVLDAVLADVRDGGVCAELLVGRDEDPLASALALRLLGGVHRIVLDGRAPELAAFYPSVGGADSGDPGPAFLTTVRRHRDEVERRMLDGVQTNEVGRSAVLVGGYAAVTRRTALPLRVLELGASAGLNLRWDHFSYDTGRAVSGDPHSSVRFRDVWEGDPPDLPTSFDVAERSGCDRSPLDATTPEGRATLMSFVWPDQLERFQRLESAIEVARSVSAEVARADAADWVEEQLGVARPGVATVVVHSIVLQYLSPAGRTRVRDAIGAAGRGASGAAPLAWLRMEPGGDRAELRLTTWPGGEERLLATAGYHGSPIWWEGG